MYVNHLICKYEIAYPWVHVNWDPALHRVVFHILCISLRPLEMNPFLDEGLS